MRSTINGTFRFRFATLLAFALLLAPGVPAGATPDDDRHHLHRVVKALSAGQRDLAQRHAAMLAAPALADYVHWRLLLDRETDHPIAAYAGFIEKHPLWPRLDNIQVRMEEAITLGGSEEIALRVLDTRGPRTGSGHIALAIAWQAAGRDDLARDLIRHLWSHQELDEGLEEIILERFASILRSGDHEARLDFLLWERRGSAARRMFRHVSTDRRRLAEARLDLQGMRPGVDGSINRVPRDLRDDPGLTFDRMRWRRRKGRDADAREILLDPPDDLVDPGVWWNERKYQIREMIDDGQFGRAWQLARRHGQSEGLAFAEAEWLAGWLALRFAGKPAEALARFESLANGVSTPISSARAAYWAGRAAAELGRGEEAESWYVTAATHATTFYGQEAAFELGRDFPLNPAPAMPAARAHGEEIADLLEVARSLCEAGAAAYALPFWQRILELKPDDPATVLHEAAECGRPDLAIRLGKRAVRSDLLDPVATYPVVRIKAVLDPPSKRADAPLMLAIARQESHFDAGARSVANALGLMQLIPPTARAIARAKDMPFSPERLARDPEYNATLASGFLDNLLDRYDGSREMTAAAYNAGPNRIRQWVARFGDPRRMDRHARIDWIERIPFSETRNYVQRVSEGYEVYRRLLAEGGGWYIEPVIDRGPMIPLPVPKARPGTT
ncbi:MAG: lytic transglycosylase domain-containing protein [Geminicoccaceae bacterium]